MGVNTQLVIFHCYKNLFFWYICVNLAFSLFVSQVGASLSNSNYGDSFLNTTYNMAQGDTLTEQTSASLHSMVIFSPTEMIVLIRFQYLILFLFLQGTLIVQSRNATSPNVFN